MGPRADADQRLARLEQIDTLCLHGDNPHAAQNAKLVREAARKLKREVALTARVSRRGSASPQPGDLQGTVQPVKVGSSGVEVIIDQVVR